MNANPIDLAEYAENLTIAYSEAYIGSNAEQETMQEMARLAPHLVSRIRELEATIARVKSTADAMWEHGATAPSPASRDAALKIAAALEGGA